MHLIGCLDDVNGKFKKYSKIFSETIRGEGLKLLLRIHANDISIYINCVPVSIVYSSCYGNL